MKTKRNRVGEVTVYSLLSSETNITRYVWGLDISGQSGGRASSQAEMQGAGGVGGLLAVVRPEGAFYPCYDANGNITEYVDTNGVVVAHYAYDAFGNITGQSGSMADDFVFRFSTKYLDAETGNIHFDHRPYKPSFGRFISRDPIEEQGGLNLYGFCGNDPINKVDYLGMDITLETGNNTGVKWNDAYHQQVCVDIWDKTKKCTEQNKRNCCHIGKACYSFGLSEENRWRIRPPLYTTTWLGWNVGYSFATILRGEIYEPDPVENATIKNTHKTTMEQDKNWQSYMGTRVGMVDAYAMFEFNCREYSQREFRDAPFHWQKKGGQQ